MTLRSEFEVIVRSVLADDQAGMDSFSIIGSGDDISYEIKPGWRTSARAFERVVPREILVELIYRTLQSRWSRYDRYAMSIRTATDDDLNRLHDKYPAVVNRCEHGPGWYDLLIATLAMTSETSPGKWYTDQIKEKFGGLCFYYHGNVNDQFVEIVDAAEMVSEHICEECGAPGRERPGGWVRTLCDVCARERRK